MSGVMSSDIDNGTSQLITVNVGGRKFRFIKQSLTYFPDARLGRLAELSGDRKAVEAAGLCDFVLTKRGEYQYFFARSAVVFEMISQFYNTGTFHFLSGYCDEVVQCELFYWGLSELQPSEVCGTCTSYRAVPPSYKPVLVSNPYSPQNVCQKGSSNQSKRGFSRANCTMPRGGVMEVLESSGVEVENDSQQEKPSNASTTVTKSTLAFHMITFSLILVNIVIMIMDSMPDYHWSCPTVKLVEFIQSGFDSSYWDPPLVNTTLNGESEGVTSIDGLLGHPHTLNPIAMVSLRLLDWFCSAWFTIEFLIRLYLSRNRRRFMCKLMSVIDLLAILPAYIELVIGYVNPETTSGSSAIYGFSALKVLRLFRIFRIFRILKLARYEDSFKALGVCLKNSYRELSLLIMYLLISTVFFGSLLYYAEADHPESFYQTIPVAIWWSLVTYFGYADAPPVTAMGKSVAAIGAIWGVLFMAFPISILVEKFAQVFQDSSARQREMAKVHDETQSVRLKSFVNKIPLTAHL